MPAMNQIQLFQSVDDKIQWEVSLEQSSAWLPKAQIYSKLNHKK
ncbi:hypothetical protein N9913_01780 [Porticoccaceae bacterium]|nr:hypothetical protein [Porticoccaceae bacterium]MDB9998912.1 hypothetical protein [Porticoccaceae bacterium]